MAQQDIVVRMGMDASAFSKGLADAKNQGKALSNSFRNLGSTAAALGIGALAARTVAYAGDVQDLSARLGISTDALQEFGYAASLSGGNLDDVAASMKRLATAVQEAVDGGEAGDKMAAAFLALGVTMTDLKTLRIEDIFRKIGAGVRDAADIQLVLNDATTVLGKTSTNVLAAMRNDLQAAADDARRLGLIIGGDVISQLDDLGDKADTMGKRMVALFAPLLSIIGEAAHRLMDLGLIVGNVLTIPARIAGAIAGGAGPIDALNQAMAGARAEAERIIAGFEERQRTRPVREQVPMAREVTESESKALKEASEIVKLKEKIAELGIAELGVAEQRKLIEKEIGEIKKKSAEDAAVIAAATAREKDIEAKRAELAGQEGIEAAAKAVANSEPVDAAGIEAKAKAELYLVELADKRKDIEAQITALKKEQSKANPAELAALKRQEKMLELKKKEGELARKQEEARRKVLEIRADRKRAVTEADEAKGERLKFSLSELAGANLRGVRDPQLRKDILAAREVARLESQAGFLKQRGGIGDLAEAAKRLSVADKVRAGITSIRDTERFPFANMDSKIASIDDTMDLLLHQAKTDGLNVRALMAN